MIFLERYRVTSFSFQLKRETNIGCQGNMANWDIEKFTFFVPICDDLDMVVRIHVLHDEHK